MRRRSGLTAAGASVIGRSPGQGLVLNTPTSQQETPPLPRQRVRPDGQTEGQTTKLKLVKRQMYGRRKFDLLHARLIGAT